MQNNYYRSHYPNSLIPFNPNSSQYRHTSNSKRSYISQPAAHMNRPECFRHDFYGRSMRVHSNQFYESSDMRVHSKHTLVYRTQHNPHNFTNRSCSVVRARPHLHAPSHSVMTLPSSTRVSLPLRSSSPYHSMVVNDGINTTREQSVNRQNTVDSSKKPSKSENSENIPCKFSNSTASANGLAASSKIQKRRLISDDNASDLFDQSIKQKKIMISPIKLTVKSELVPFVPPEIKQIAIPESADLELLTSTSSTEHEELNLQPESLDSENAPENESITSSITLTSIHEDASKLSVSRDPDVMNMNPYGRCVFQHTNGRFCRTKTKNMFCKKHRELIQKLAEMFKYSITDLNTSSSQQIIETQLPQEFVKDPNNHESQCFEKKMEDIIKILECLQKKVDSISTTCTSLERKIAKIEVHQKKSPALTNSTDRTLNSSTPFKSIIHDIRDDDLCPSKISTDVNDSVDDTEIHTLISNRKFLLEILGKYLIYSSITTLTVFDVRADTIAGIHKSKHESSITCIHSCNSDGKFYLFCGSADKSLSCYISKNLVFTYTLDLGKSISAIGSGKSLLFVGFDDGDLAAYSFSGVLQTSFKSYSFTSSITSIQCIRITNKDAAIVGTSSGEVKTIDGNDGHLLKSVLQGNSQILAMCVNKSKLYCGTFDGKFLIMNSSINSKKQVFEGYRHLNGITSIDFMKNTIFTSCLDRYVRTLNENGELLTVYGATNDPIVDMKVFDSMIFFTTSKGSLLSLDPQYSNWLQCKWNDCNIHYINIKMLTRHIIENHCELSQRDSSANVTSNKFHCKWNICSFSSENISYREICEHLSVHIQ